MYDYHPFQDGVEARSANHYNAAMNFRGKSLQHELPCFAYLQAYDTSIYRFASESEIRWEAFSLLTMGMKGLSYFTYVGETDSVYTGLLAGSTTKGPMYDDVAAMNPELSNLGNVLTSSTSTDVRFVQGPGGGTLPTAFTNWSTGAGGDTHITNIQVVESGLEKNGLVGFFTDDNAEELFMLTNLNHDSTLSAAATAVTFEVTFDSSVDDLLCWDRATNEQTVVTLDNHMLEVVLPGGTGNLYKYNDGVDFIYFEEPADVTLGLVDNGSPARGLHSYTLTATGTGITTLSKFTIDGLVNQVFDSENPTEWLGDGSASESEEADSYVIFGDVRIPDLGGETWDYETYPDGPPDKVTEETEGKNKGKGTLNNYDETLDISDSYIKLGVPSTVEETVDLIQIVIKDGNGFDVDVTISTAATYDPVTGNALVNSYDLSLSFLPAAAASVPEPSVLVLLAGMLVLGLLRRKIQA